MATLMLTADGGTLANLDHMSDVRLEPETSTRTVIVGRSAGVRVDLFSGTHDECLEELRRITNVMNAEGHVVIDQSTAKVHRAQSVTLVGAAAKQLEGVALVDPTEIPEAIHPGIR